MPLYWNPYIARIGTADDINYDESATEIRGSVPTGGFFSVQVNNTERLRFGMNGNNVRILGSPGANATELVSAGSLSLETQNGIVAINAVSGGVPDVYLLSNGQTRVLVQAAGVQLFSATPSYGGGTLVLGVANATGVPGSNPTGGGILYATGGAGTWRGSGGTVTTFGPADPHCPVCDRDYVFEWRNDDAGEHLAICVSCMLEELSKNKIDTNKFVFISTLIDPNVRRGKMSVAKKRDEDAEADRIAREQAKKSTKRGQWEERQRLAAEAARAAQLKRGQEQTALLLATSAAQAAGDGDDEAATWHLAKAAEYWKLAGEDDSARLALDLAESINLPGAAPDLADLRQELGLLP